MANQVLGLGGNANDGTGDTLRAAADKINDNFLEIYTLIGDTSSLSSGISATASVVTLTAPTITGVVGGTQTSATITTLATTTVNGTTLNGGTLALAAGSITDSSGAISFGNENLTTTGTITGALATAAQTAITSVGTLTALQVDNININGNAISSTAGTDLTIAPLSGQQIVLDGTIIIDAGVVTGATSITSTAFVGDITGDVTGNADTATALATARTIGGTSFDGSANIAVALASVGTAVTVADESSDTTCFPLFATAATGDLPPKSGSNLTFNASSGLLTATLFAGALTGNVTGNASGTAATVTGAAQTAITSVGTLTALQVDNLNINANTISSTAGTDLLITPLAGQQIVLDGTIIIDAGVVTGATSITSTAFVGDITGDVTGNADTATALATARTIGGTSFDGSANIAVGLATLATTVTITDNESTNENNAIIFTAGGDVDGGNLGLESDGTLTYNPSTGKITATGFVGTLTGNVTGNLAGTVSTATQNSITTATGLVSVGALDSGSITSGFTSIDVGAGTITTTGAITGGSVAGRKTLVSTFNTTSAVTASLTAAQSGATILIDGTENNVINLPAAAVSNPGIFYDLIVRVAVASDKTTIVNIAGSGGGFVGALSLAGGTAANAVFDNAGDALTFVNSTVIGSRARITCIVDDGTDGTWQVECLASPIATIA